MDAVPTPDRGVGSCMSLLASDFGATAAETRSLVGHDQVDSLAAEVAMLQLAAGIVVARPALDNVSDPRMLGSWDV